MTMTKIAKKNIALSEKFSKYIMRNPKKAEQLAMSASIVLFPRNDKELAEENKKILKTMGKKAEVYIAKELAKGWSIRVYAKN